VFLRETGEVALSIVSDASILPPIDSIDVQADADVQGMVHYSAFAVQPPTAHLAGLILQFYLDDQPHATKLEMAVLPALVVRLPGSKDVTWSQQPIVVMESLVQLTPGNHRIVVHGGGYQNAEQDTAITLSHRLLYFLQLASGKS
jgi:hypothetical protein